MKKTLIHYLQMFLPFILMPLLPIWGILKGILLVVWMLIIIWWLDKTGGNINLFQFLKRRMAK